ncbi:MAG: DNA topoisomerase IV subunit B [Pseudomonadota bacterium]|nr:DNA topoisomerase IV subunit B [Pseudomonadota bacterium]
MQRKYTSSDIEVLQGIEPVQKRPGMYTDTSCPNHLIQEVIDNSVDEAIAGYGKEIKITLEEDGSIIVEDDGRGMPVDKHPDFDIPGVEVIMTHLHSGAKFSEKNYRYSGGLHGVGVSVVNALSSFLKVDISRKGDDKKYSISFANGNVKKQLTTTGKSIKNKEGTTIHFLPNPKYFETLQLNIKELLHLIKAKSILQSGLKLVVIDNKYGSGTQEFCHAGGLKEYLISNIDNSNCCPKDTYYNSINSDNYNIEWSITWLNNSNEPFQESYVNLIPTSQGGTHVNLFRSGIVDAIREFCDRHSILPKNIRLTPEDIWKNSSFILSLKMNNPQFSGQTKNKLQSNHLLSNMNSQVKDKFELWLNHHAETGEALTDIAIKNAEIRMSSDKQSNKRVSTKNIILPSRLADCISENIDENELFLVEGDSAGGSAKQARDKSFQAILPLRGKILNTWELSSSKILESKEVKDISLAIGVDPGKEEVNVDNLRYGKICILADADSDGMHIATLLTALFLAHFKELVLLGRIYVAKPPLYRIDIKKETYYVVDDIEKTKLLKKLKIKEDDKNLSVTRFKGLGEMNPPQLRDTTLAKETRKLIQLTTSSNSKDTNAIDKLLSKKRVLERREWLESKGNLVQID